jgi:hypothetical protein
MQNYPSVGNEWVGAGGLCGMVVNFLATNLLSVAV